MVQVQRKAGESQVQRKAGESGSTCGNRYLNFFWKWVKDCSTLGYMVELSSIDAVTKLMPKPISNHVRDHAPTTLKKATKLADVFMLTRGWSLDQISDREVPHRDNGKRHHRREEHQQPKKDRNYQQEELESPRSKSTDVSNGKSNGNWKKQPKFDPVRGPRCFSCNEYGHYSSKCPTKKEHKNLPRLEDLNLAVTLTAREEADLVESEIVCKVIIPGKVAGQDVSQIPLDTGADRAMVKSCLVSETAKTGEVVLMESYTGKVESHPLAEVELEVAHRRVTLKVALEVHGKYDVLLGTDFPGLWELGRQLVNALALQLVQTRSQTVRNEGNRHQENMETDRESPIEEATLEWSETETETDSEQESGPSEFAVEEPSTETELTDSKRKKHSRSAKRAERKAWREKGLEKVLQEQEKEAFKEQQDEHKTLDALRQQAETKDSPFMMKDGLLWKRSIDRMGEDVLLLCIPAEKRGLLLSLAHKPGHLGRDRTYRRLADEYHWSGMYADEYKMC